MGNNLNKKKARSSKRSTSRNLDTNEEKTSVEKNGLRMEAQNQNEIKELSIITKQILQPFSVPSSYSFFPSSKLKPISEFEETKINSTKSTNKEIIIYGISNIKKLGEKINIYRIALLSLRTTCGGRLPRMPDDKVLFKMLQIDS